MCILIYRFYRPPSLKVACGCYHTICLSADGLTFPFGRNNHGQLGVDTDDDKDTPQVVEALRGSRVCQVREP